MSLAGSHRLTKSRSETSPPMPPESELSVAERLPSQSSSAHYSLPVFHSSSMDMDELQEKMKEIEALLQDSSPDVEEPASTGDSLPFREERRVFREVVEILKKYEVFDKSVILDLQKTLQIKRLVSQLGSLDLNLLTPAERLPFFVNLHNITMVDAIITNGSSPGLVGRLNFGKYQYIVGGYSFSVLELEHAIVRGNNAPSGVVASLLALPRINPDEPKFQFVNEKQKDPRLNFALHYGTVSSPFFRFFSAANFGEELQSVTKEYLIQHVRIKENKKEIQLPKIMKYYIKDFGKSSKEILNWVINTLDGTKLAKELREVDQQNSSLCYEKYNWDFQYVIENKERNQVRLDLIHRMMNPNKGIILRDRKIKLTTYSNVFLGNETVDWMMGALPLRSREEAVAVGQKLVDCHLIEHVSNDNNQFKDDKSMMYRFSAQMTADYISSSLQQKSNNRKFTMDDFEQLHLLGTGGYGKVVLVRQKESGKIYALKIVKKSKVKGDERFVLYERTALVNTHPYLVHLQYSFQTNDELCFVMDYIAGGNLMTHLRRLNGGLSKPVARFVAAELLLALEYLHGMNILYRDLKPENVLIDRDGHVVLTDFGLSKTLGDDERTSTIAGTLIYMAPEVLKGEQYGIEADWWAYGVLLYLIISGYHPFYSQSQYEVTERIIRKPLDLSKCTDKKALDLIQNLLTRDPKDRWGSARIKGHPYFAKIKWDQLLLKKVKSPFKIEVKGELDVSNFDATSLNEEEEEKKNEIQTPNDFFMNFSFVNRGSVV